jgi:hypothetical protein
MQTTVRIMTKPETYDERIRQLIDAGYEIDREAPVPVNGLCSFRATKKANSENYGEAARD